MYFGVAFYHRRELSSTPATVVGLARIMEGWANVPLSFQGMLKGRDRFTPLKRLSPRAQEKLLADLSEGVYSDFVAYLGPRDAPSGSIAFDLTPRTTVPEPAYPGTLYLTLLLATPHQAASASALAEEIWNLLEPACGIAVWGPTFTDVYSELSVTPISDWRAPPNPRKEARLLGLQRSRHLIGEYLRGAAWGTYLGKHLVDKLGGIEAIAKAAPVTAVRALTAGGAYLQLAAAPLSIGSADYEAASSLLEQYLSPVLVPL